MAELLKDVDLQKNGSSSTVKGGEALKVSFADGTAKYCPVWANFALAAIFLAIVEVSIDPLLPIVGPVLPMFGLI